MHRQSSSDNSSSAANQADGSVRVYQEEAAIRDRGSWFHQLARIFFRRSGYGGGSEDPEDGEDEEAEEEEADDEEEEERRRLWWRRCTSCVFTVNAGVRVCAKARACVEWQVFQLSMNHQEASRRCTFMQQMQ